MISNKYKLIDPYKQARLDYEETIRSLDMSITQAMNNLFICGDLTKPFSRVDAIIGLDTITLKPMGLSLIRYGDETLSTSLEYSVRDK